MDYTEPRQRLVDWLRSQLIGPAGDARLSMSPLERYPTGVLHPVDPGVSGTDPASAEQLAEPDANSLEDADDQESADGDEPENKVSAQPVRRRRYVPPSSVGFSFCIQGDARLLITVSAARYQVNELRDTLGRYAPDEFERSPLDTWSVTWKPGGQSAWKIWEVPGGAGRAGIDVRARPHAAGTIFSVTLFNRGRLEPEVFGRRRKLDRIEKSLFEARIECAIEAGSLVEYPRVDPSLLTKEERELELQYRGKHIYAVGHGGAVDWTIEPDNCARIWSEFMPTTEVPMVDLDSHPEHQEALSMRRLTHSVPYDALERFVAGYGDWIAKRQREADGLPDNLERTTAARMCERMVETQRRMRRGIGLLRTEPLAERSFRLANRAMLDQMRKAHETAGKNSDPDNFAWRPFQLAFLLMAMESTITEDDDFRDVLDLIWFPTGGGKTEAYLGLIAFLIVWRRLKYGSAGGGTVAFMRYTLRLLTRQQFERAAGVVFALELIRREQPEGLGEEPIAIGMWVGSAISPNRFDKAWEAARKPDARQKLVVDRCLWCGTELDTMLGSYRASDRAFQFHCPDLRCEFGGDPVRPLPCNVVDDALYERPPTLLIGTIDKFARLAWEPRAGAFFGARASGQTPVRPPELVIQDELHLVTGPLGSVAGVYEAGLDTLLNLRGVRPKYVASTATIRMAKEQVKRLYARKLAVFPPPGLSCDDSWFARTNYEKAGRLYVGYLAPALDLQHCMAPLAAALLAAPEALFDQEQDREALLDAWWTQVVYHGSLKGVGNSHNAFMTNVRDFGRRLHGEQAERSRSVADGEGSSTTDYIADGEGEPRPGAGSIAGNNILARFANCRIDQLTSLKTAQDNARTFDQLATGRESDGCLDAVLATNMVSVGLDVARLALMMVNGQPLTTAEYIQASSRVGRDKVPGLVLANYYRHQARSLSHYESFRPYHESFYRFVESTSVTPYTFQVRSRALHAALVIAVRHACSALRNNRSAGQFDPDISEVRGVVKALKLRCANAAGNELAGKTTEHIDALVAEWRDEAKRCETEHRQLNYQSPDHVRNAERLLCSHDATRRGLWRTLHSMRNVESSGEFRLYD